MEERRSYSIGRNRLERACLDGLRLTEENTLETDAEKAHRYLFLGSVNGVKADNLWGRFRSRIHMQGNMGFILRAFAGNDRTEPQLGTRTLDQWLLDQQVSSAEKTAYFEQRHALRFVNQKDVLLYELKGRYLWLSLEFVGTGAGSVRDMKLLPGDTFMQMFPELYRERNSFFHRYLSVWSSLYQDFQEEIGQVHMLLEPDTCPKNLLAVYGRWLGLGTETEFLEEEKLRLLVQHAHILNRKKGTKKAVEKLLELLLGEKPVVLERNLLKDGENKELYDRLYGKSRFSVTVLVYSQVEKKRRAGLLYLLEQFVPVRCVLKLVFLEKEIYMDTYCYLDINAGLEEEKTAVLDQKVMLES